MHIKCHFWLIQLCASPLNLTKSQEIPFLFSCFLMFHLCFYSPSHPVFFLLFMDPPYMFHCFTSLPCYLTPSSSSPPSLCLSISHLFIKPSAIPVTQFILTSFICLATSKFSAHSILVYIACCLLTSTLLTPTIHLPLSSPVISPSHLYCSSAVERWFSSLSHIYFLCVFQCEIPSILVAAFVGWFYYVTHNCWIIQ